MPKRFSEKERKAIYKDLKETALRLILTKGIRKVTVDEIVEAVHIPKGTFYLFYQSKELLLFDAIKEVEKKMHQEMEMTISLVNKDTSVDEMTDLIVSFYQKAYEYGFLQLMMSGEMDILIRKLPDEIVELYIQEDGLEILAFTALFPNMREADLLTYSAAFRGIFMMGSYAREIGYDSFLPAVRVLVKGLIMQVE